MLEGDGLIVVGEASDGLTALAAIEELQPHVVLLDLQLPDLSGFEVARQITGGTGERPAVVLTSTRDGADFDTLIADSGACGFIDKSDISGAALRGLVG